MPTKANKRVFFIRAYGLGGLKILNLKIREFENLKMSGAAQIKQHMPIEIASTNMPPLWGYLSDDSNLFSNCGTVSL
jgi:hypothetical protein